MTHQSLIFTNDVSDAIRSLRESMGDPSAWVLMDKNVARLVRPRIECGALDGTRTIVVLPGDSHKNLTTLSSIWNQLQKEGATRRSLLINLGGGVVTDMGGFAGATFKRGMRFINVPTTLLSAVDAAVGGKTGINFNGFKNEIGAFCEASAVVISSCFFDTLPREEVLSGYAEMLKHGLLSGRAQYDGLLAYDPSDGNADDLLRLLNESVEVKCRIVLEDPHEKGLRKALNLGHTVGHAFESLALERCKPIAHGYAVAWGCVVELVLSHMQMGFPADELRRFSSYVLEHYGAYFIECNDYPALLEYMRHDKKNDSEAINFTLLRDVGSVEVNCICDESEIKIALDLYRDLMHI